MNTERRDEIEACADLPRLDAWIAEHVKFGKA